MASKLDYSTNAETIKKKLYELLAVTEKQEKVGLKLDQNARQLDRDYNKLAQTVDKLTKKFRELNRVSGVGPSGNVNVSGGRQAGGPNMGVTNSLLAAQLLSRRSPNVNISTGYNQRRAQRMAQRAWEQGAAAAHAEQLGERAIGNIPWQREAASRAILGRPRIPMMGFNAQGGFEAVSKSGGAVGGAAGQFASALGAASGPLVAVGVTAAAAGIALGIYKVQLDKNREVAGRYAAVQEEAIKKLVDAQKAIATSAMDMQAKLLPMQLQGQLLGITPDRLKQRASFLAAETPLTDYEQATSAVVAARKKFGGKANTALEIAALGERAGVGTVSDILDKLTKKAVGKDIERWPSVLTEVARQNGVRDTGVEARITRELAGRRTPLTSRAMAISRVLSEEQYQLGVKGERGPAIMQEALTAQERVQAFLSGIERPDLGGVKAKVGPPRRAQQLRLTYERMKAGGDIVSNLTPEARAGLDKFATDPFTRQTIEILDEMQRVKKELKAQAKESSWMQAYEMFTGGPLDEMVTRLNELNRQLESLSENMKKVNGSTTPTTGAGR